VSTIREFVAAARVRLETAGVEPDEAAMDAALMARHALNWDLARFVAHETDRPPEGFLASYDDFVARRAARQPMSVVLGRREFWGLEFDVTPAVLAPRPETEIVLEAALDVAGRAGWKPAPPGATGVRPVTIVDVGTGSGCLAVCLAREFPSARVVATDISREALVVAGRNAARHGVRDRVALVRTSLLSGLRASASLIVSNPPYVPTGEIATLPPEVRDWEPHGALDGGADGLDAVRALLEDAPRVLVPGGWLIMEFGFGQHDGVREALARSALALDEIRLDLQGIPRTLVARRTV
jgi:release factor glutamine methyltransferase